MSGNHHTKYCAVQTCACQQDFVNKAVRVWCGENFHLIARDEEEGLREDAKWQVGCKLERAGHQ